MSTKVKYFGFIFLFLSLFHRSPATANESDLVWNTFLGGSDGDHGSSLVLDLSGNPVVIGHTWSSDFPTTLGAYNQTHNGLTDVFVARISASGDSLLWSTFLGGSDFDEGHSLVLDLSGNLVLAGHTQSSDFPTTTGAYDQTHNAEWDIFVAQLSASGDSLLWSTFLGGSDGDHEFSLALDLSGKPVVTGYTQSSDFPTTAGAYDQSHSAEWDIFVAQLSTSGDSLLWSTFLGGSDNDCGISLVLDFSGNPVVTGYTQSSDFPTTPGAYDQTYNYWRDGFVAKLSASGDSLLWSTFLGGSISDYGYSLFLDLSGDLVVTGYTQSSDFPTTPGAYDQTHNAGWDIFLARLSASGDSLLWSTFLGGSDWDEVFSLVLDLSGNSVVTGYTQSSDFPTTPVAYDQTHNGLSDIFVARLSASGDSLLWSTFLGGSDNDYGRSLVLDPSGNPVVTGYTYSLDFPSTPGAYDQTHNGATDIFVAKFEICTEVELTEQVIGQPETFELSQNYPNPFNNSTTIPYQLDEPSNVNIILYNILGQRVRDLVNEHKDPGYYLLSWDGKDQSGSVVASGIYLCRIKVGQYEKTIRMLFLK
jgi:hypothetical protein